MEGKLLFPKANWLANGKNKDIALGHARSQILI